MVDGFSFSPNVRFSPRNYVRMATVEYRRALAREPQLKRRAKVAAWRRLLSRLHDVRRLLAFFAFFGLLIGIGLFGARRSKPKSRPQASEKESGTMEPGEQGAHSPLPGGGEGRTS